MNVSSAIRSGSVEHARLAGVPALMGFAVVLTSMLALVFPTGKEYAELATVIRPDRYSLAYLDVMIRANPEEIELRLVYVRQLGILGRFYRALELLEPALRDPRYQAAAKEMRFDLRLAQARSIPEEEASRQETFALALRDLEVLLPMPHDASRLRELSKVALELERPRLASEFLLQLAEQSDEHARPAIYADAAHWFRASGDGRRAAEYYDKAAALITNPMMARVYALASVAALEAENAVHEAADRAAHYAAKYPNDVEMLMRATTLATACSRDAVARDLGRRVLALAPELMPEDQVSDTFLRQQARRELALSDPAAALKLVKRLVARHPRDADLRETEARIAEWAGDLHLALRDWVFLMKIGRRTTTAPMSRTEIRL